MDRINLYSQLIYDDVKIGLFQEFTSEELCRTVKPIA